ncbi:hypothetical protein [Actinoallomurus iriomotensis]|uniref:Knr4/Smi1-like domain-containing protein n=1 Tax=Actinoallomurus iriomotensis TaxID=478107 RepID=A0A9W6RMX6_9ACTN|nr:hypothetical protein [Actinoallomurus iriomotensis]GLY78826.1 hypothetical protein Airi01_070930 [Actinoallomurus iriomotensis]
MTKIFDVGRELATGIGDRADAWRFIRGFAAGWQAPLTDDDGCPASDLDAAEARLGLRLPTALREAYRLFGRREDLTANQDVLLSPDRLHLDGEVLVFRVENQAVVHWGVPVSELEEPDPSVVVRASLADPSAERWEPWLDRFSLACVEIVLSESLFVSEELGDNRGIADGESDLLERHYTRLPLPDYPTSQTTVPAIRWFAGRDVIIRDDQRTWMWVRARTCEALTTVRTELPGDWIMTGTDEPN